jgi:uncharacterized protein
MSYFYRIFPKMSSSRKFPYTAEAADTLAKKLDLTSRFSNRPTRSDEAVVRSDAEPLSGNCDSVSVRNPLKVDRRSYHSFTFQGETFLFDRATGTLFQLEMPFSENAGAPPGPEAVHAIVTELVESGSAQKMFQYAPVDFEEQERLMESLWQHHPRRIQMLMAQGCNLGCRYCYAWRNGSNQKGTLMPWEIARQTVDYLVQKSGRRRDLQVTFFGGEPLLNLPVIQQVVAYCRHLEQTTEKRFTFELITNGTLLTPEVADWVAAEKFLLFISIDGWKEMHNYNRPSMSGEDMYDVILRHAQYARKVYEQNPELPPIKVRANLTNRHHDARAVGEYLASLGFKVIGVGAIEPLSHGDPSPSAMTEDQMDELHQKTTGMLVEVLQRMIAGQPVTYFESVQIKKATSTLEPCTLKGITCGVARNTAIVDNKGNLFPCHRYEGMENYILGDVFSGLDRERTMTYYRKVNRNATNRCHSCWIRDYCGGGCAWLLSARDGHLADPTERECDRRRKSMERALWLRQKMRMHFPERFAAKRELDMAAWQWEGLEEVISETVRWTPEIGPAAKLRKSVSGGYNRT